MPGGGRRAGTRRHPAGTLDRVTDRPVRVRFAPSPTGYFHVGGARTALYNWLFARQHEGTFVLRIEDTDAERNRPEWTEGILSALRWIGVDWDEGPVLPVARVERHREAARSAPRAGPAPTTATAPATQIDARTKGNATPGYDGFCRDRGLEPGRGPGAALPHAPAKAPPRCVDLIRGQPRVRARTLEDFVILRGNGTPMFLLANVVDDIDMGITHVIRGEEHLPNTPKAQLLWEALDGGPSCRRGPTCRCW